MIKNNKGFMLIEVIVTSTVVVTTMIALYTAFNRLYNNYRTRNSYYNIDAVYATKEMINSMIESKNEKNNINTYISSIFSTQDYGYVIKDNKCTEDLIPSNCSIVQGLYKVNSMIFIKYKLDTLNSLMVEDVGLNQTFNEYIEYLITYYNVESTTEDYNYIVLTEIKDGDSYYYANLRMR